MPNRLAGFPMALGLRSGDLVEVRSAEEILATLDENGELDQTPFMPEMLGFCGKQLRVDKRADKSCDTLYFKGMRRLRDTVHLQDARCEGSYHGACQARCLVYWKEAWLKRPGDPPLPLAQLPPPKCSLSTLEEKCRKSHDPSNPDEDVFSCQATEQHRFSTPLSPWDIRQYVRDLVTGNAKLRQIVVYAGVAIFNWFQHLRSGGQYPSHFRTSVRPVMGKTPTVTLNVQPGEMVQVKTRDELIATLDENRRNRGLYFDHEMVKFCGGKYRVLRRVDTIINEQTGKMMHFKNDCIVLDGVVCESDYHAMCPRKIQAYWREIWLRRTDPQPAPTVKT